jgi:hypothetical protein
MSIGEGHVPHFVVPRLPTFWGVDPQQALDPTDAEVWKLGRSLKSLESS